MRQYVESAAWWLRTLVRQKAGATSIEYALIAVLISIVVAAWAGSMGSSLNSEFENIGTTIKGS